MALPLFIGEKMAKHILSCSFGKDSIATALLALQQDVYKRQDNELNDVVMATSIAKVDGAASSQSFEVVRSKDANADFTEQQTLKFYNDREKAKVGVYKVDRETGKYLAGAVFNLYAADDIYSVDGKLLFAAGELVATSPETGADGYTYFDCDIPIRGEYYGSSIRKDATTNSGNYIVKELRAPLGYYVNEEPMEVTFTLSLIHISSPVVTTATTSPLAYQSVRLP